MTDNDIEDCYRITQKNGREGPIIVKLKEIKTRDLLFKELKKLKPKLSIINKQPKDKNIYINEALTKNQKDILYRVRQAAKDKNWNRVWTYSGTVYLKMEREGRQIKIENFLDLETLLK